MKKRIFSFSMKDITEIAILCAVAIIFDSFIKIPLGATGGSLNFSMLPLIIICLRHGAFKGFIASGIVYGLITCLLDGYGFNTYPLEYFLSFGAISIIGFFGKYINDNYHNKKILIGVILFFCLALWGTLRLIFASIDSIVLYKYSLEAALSYNATYIFLTAPTDYIMLMIILPFVIRINKMYKTTYLNGDFNNSKENSIKCKSTIISDNEIDFEIKIKK